MSWDHRSWDEDRRIVAYFAQMKCIVVILSEAERSRRIASIEKPAGVFQAGFAFVTVLRQAQDETTLRMTRGLPAAAGIAAASAAEVAAASGVAAAESAAAEVTGAR